MRRRHDAVPHVGPANPNWRGGRSLTPYTSYVKAFKIANPEKVRAHRRVMDAVRVGRLVRPALCSACGCACRPQAHHDDYTQPLAVRWLCKPCHNAADAMKRSA